MTITISRENVITSTREDDTCDQYEPLRWEIALMCQRLDAFAAVYADTATADLVGTLTARQVMADLATTQAHLDDLSAVITALTTSPKGLLR